MRREERERLVERYLDGALDHEAEQEFFIQVALDGELRRTLKSYRIVDETIRMERESAVHGHAPARQALAGILDLAPVTGATITASAESSASGTLMRRFVAGLAGTVLLVIALLMVGPVGAERSDTFPSPSPDAGSTASADHSAPVLHATHVFDADAFSSTVNRAAVNAASALLEARRTHALSATAARQSRPSATGTVSGDGPILEPPSAMPPLNPAAGIPNETRQSTSITPNTSAAAPNTASDDSIKIPVQIELPPSEH